MEINILKSKTSAAISFVKQWSLLFAIITGGLTYTLFTRIPWLIPIGDFAGPLLLKAMPYLIFTMLYVTFCRIRINDLRPRPWHFILQGIRVFLSGIAVLATLHAPSAETRLIAMGIFVCIVCPTAAAAPVITEKLGGNIASLTVFTIIANIVTAIIIPLYFPMLERSAHIDFMTAFMLVLRRVTAVLLLPLCLALLTRRVFPRQAVVLRRQRQLPFVIWCVNLSIVMGLTLHNISVIHTSPGLLLPLMVAPLIVSIALFSIGKFTGSHYGESIGAGQALGQKNTVVGIWLTITFLNPIASIAPCTYVIWQNLINAWQLWYKQRYGKLKW